MNEYLSECIKAVMDFMTIEVSMSCVFLLIIFMANYTVLLITRHLKIHKFFLHNKNYMKSVFYIVYPEQHTNET